MLLNTFLYCSSAFNNRYERGCVEIDTPFLPYISRDEATRTPDPYVPNVVRYQLRYIPIFTNLCKGGCKVSEKSRNSETFI